MIKTIVVTLAAIAFVANGESNLRSNTAAEVEGNRCKRSDLSKDKNLLNNYCRDRAYLWNNQYCMLKCPDNSKVKVKCKGSQWEPQRCAPTAPSAPTGDKFYAVMGKISGRKKPLAPAIGVHCLSRGTTKATEAPYNNKIWGQKHGALSVQCCGAENFRSNTDNNKKWVVKEQQGVFATRFTRNVVPGGQWNLDACKSGKTFDEAFDICAKNGLRLCTKDEVMANEQNVGCNTGSNLQWTGTPCDGAVGGTPNKDVSKELNEIRDQFKNLIAAEEPATKEEEQRDDKFECTTDKNFIIGSYSQIEVVLNGQPSRKIFDEYEAVAFCRNECDKREASGEGCKAFWYQRHRPNPNERRGTHGYKVCAFYKKNGRAVRHGHGGKSQVCVRKAGSAGAVASSASAAAPPAAAPADSCKKTGKTYSQGARCQGSGYRKTVGWCCSAYGKKKGYQWK